MKKARFQTALLMILVIIGISLAALLLSFGRNTDVDIVREGAAGAVPEKTALIQNLTDYCILAEDRNFVYCFSDKQTFKKSGFTSTANVGN